jgi:hypothetical protein
MFRSVMRTLAGVLLLGLVGTLPLQAADDVVLKPFVLGNTPAGNMEQVVAAVKDALKAQGFEEAGSYSPYPGATVIVVTSPELLAAAAKSEHGGFGAIQRVAVTDVKGKPQVSYTNPVYMANAYRMAEDLKNVSAKLEAALGRKEEFGAKGLTTEKLRKYHYMFGMEYFTDPSVLAEYGSYDEAVKAVEAGLAAGRGGTSKVYRVDIPGKQETLFGVGLKAASDKDKAMDDKYIMSEIDFRDVKSTAHLPYEMLVDGNKVYALYARFRIAIDFPDLSMMGSHSFMNIMSSPEAIRKALVEAAGGKK